MDKGYGELIKSHRKMNGISQRRLASKIGVSNSTISKIESEVHIPDIATMVGIVKFLDTLSLSELLSKFGYIEEEDNYEYAKIKKEYDSLKEKMKIINMLSSGDLSETNMKVIKMLSEERE